MINTELFHCKPEMDILRWRKDTIQLSLGISLKRDVPSTKTVKEIECNSEDSDFHSHPTITSTQSVTTGSGCASADYFIQ